MTRKEEAIPLPVVETLEGLIPSESLGFFPKIVTSPSLRSEGDARSEQYNTMDKYYADYRRDDITQASVNARAEYATNKGFETTLEFSDPTLMDLPEKEKEEKLNEFAFVKRFVDRINKRVNLDERIRNSIIKTKIYGWMGFEIVLDRKGIPARLISRKVERVNASTGEGLLPVLDRRRWTIKSFTYRGKENAFAPEEILWFTNNALDDDFAGISELEGTQHYVETKRYATEEALKESIKALWTPYVILQFDTKGASPAQASKIIQDVLKKVKAGRLTGVNQLITPTVIDMAPRITDLIATLDYLDSEIIGSHRVPKFLIGREKQFNRATAFAEGQLFINGPVTDDQRYWKRELEAQWYDMLVRLAFEQEGKPIPVRKEPPVAISHNWNPITIEDWSEIIDKYMNAFNAGILPKKTVIEKFGLDVAEIIKLLKEEESPGEQEEISRMQPSSLFEIQGAGGQSYKVMKYTPISKASTQPEKSSKS